MVRLAITIVFSLVLSACDIGGNNNVLLKQIYNTNNEKRAVLFLKENGATSDNSLQVSILSANHELSKEEAGNVFTVDSNHDSTSQNENSMNILWVSNDSLKIEYDKRLRTFIKESTHEGVTIVYVPK